MDQLSGSMRDRAASRSYRGARGVRESSHAARIAKKDDAAEAIPPRRRFGAGR
jgi:hypothetical protein